MVLSGSLTLLKRQMTEPALTALVKKAEDAATAIRRQIEFTKTYENLGTCSPQWQDLRQVIGLLPKILIPVQADIPAVGIFADPMLELVFANLLDNTQRHGQDVSSILVTVEEKPEGLAISWNDDGVGIPDEEKEKIFERGFGKNTGLGLFLVREILDITRITIRETGEPGKGVRFEMTVPKGMYRFSSGK
jgi:signal transduction histidine kinase